MQKREYFLGGNTAKGFFSYYDYLIRQEDAAKIYVIKGGPGTGKSSLMKEIAKSAQEKGLSMDLIHCSSDPDSLDGLVIPAWKIAFVDGTSPHVVDPKTPGAVDTIIYLGDCWQEEDIAPLKYDIIRYNRQIGSYFASAYRFLAAAQHIYQDSIAATSAFARPAVTAALGQLRETYIKPLAAAAETEGRLRKLFMTALTPSGIICHVPSFKGVSVCVLEGDGFLSSEILHELCADYLARGYDAEAFYSPLNPDTQIDHLYIPGLSLLFATHDLINQFPVPENAKLVSLAVPLPDDSEFTVNQNKMLLLNLLDVATQTIQKAKSVHDLLENCYVPHMDFRKVEQIKNRILDALPNE